MLLKAWTGPVRQSDGGQRWTRRLPYFIVALIALIGVCTIVDIVHDRATSAEAGVFEDNIAQVARLRSALVDTGAAVRGYVLSGGRADYLGNFRTASQQLDKETAQLPPGFAVAARRPTADAPPAPVEPLAELRSVWDQAIKLTTDGQRPAAETTLTSPATQDLVDRVRAATTEYSLAQSDALEALNHRAEVASSVLQGATLACVLFAIAAMIYAFGNITRAIGEGFKAKNQTDELFAMADMLQSAAGQDDTNEVLRATAATMLPGFSGTLYVFNNSRDRLDLSTRWGPLAEHSGDHIAPTACWALKRGKPHLNRLGEGALRCSHVHDEQVVLEIPMAARGQLYGLLELIADGPDSAERLREIQPVATAMGDAMSLALSSIALRERLRNQALRDSLTGLYNRRFLEEMLERVCQDADRRKAPVSAIMIDLDHFKQINDKHGHGAGDAILRDVAATIMSSLRSVDVACRYGGEELAILLPDCSLDSAAGKAEQIRSRIATTTGAGGLSVTASLGVASIPETSSGAGDLLPVADAALYLAKQQGRDRVVTAAVRRPPPQKLSLIEPVPHDRPPMRDEKA